MKRIGDYIREVNVRNRDLGVGLLLGVSITKRFIPSIANTIGTDMSTYKLINKGQFAYGSVTSRNGEKVSIALLADHDTAIVSQAYTVFEITDIEVLLPEYLMMWFLRPEFDRYARVKSHGSARETFDWSELCSVELPIPSLEKQQSIVSEYNVLKDRIKLNEQLCSRLEQTAQAIYRKWFVDDIDPENLPDGWKMGTIGSDVNILDKYRRPLSSEQRMLRKGNYPYYGAMSIVDYVDSYIYDGIYLLFSEDGVNIIDEYGHPALQYVWGKFWLNNHAHIIQGNEIISTEYLYLALKNVTVAHLITGAAQPKINQENMAGINILIPDKYTMTQFDDKISKYFQLYRLQTEENIILNKLRDILLSKLATN